MILVRAQPGGRAAEMRAGAARLTQCLERGQTAEAAGWADCCREWRQEIRVRLARWRTCGWPHPGYCPSVLLLGRSRLQLHRIFLHKDTGLRVEARTAPPAQACVAEEVTDDALAALLDANDALNAALRLWQQAQARGEAARQSTTAPEAPGAGAGAGRTPPAQAAAGAPYRPEQHSQWYSPLESSLPGQAPLRPAMHAESSGSPEATSRPAAAAPASSGTDARARADATPPADGVAVPDWLVRGPAPLIDLLSWHEPSEPAAGTPAATAPAGVPARAAARRGAGSSGEKPASTARSRPSSVPARSDAAAAGWAAPGLGKHAGSARVAGGSPYEQPAAPPEADPATPPPGWQAFGADASLLVGAPASAEMAPAPEAAPRQPSAWGGSAGRSPPRPAPGGAAWARSGGRRAAAAVSDMRQAGAPAAAEQRRASSPASAAAAASPVAPAAAAAAAQEKQPPSHDGSAVQAAGARPASSGGDHRRPGGAAAAPAAAQDAELQRLRAELRCVCRALLAPGCPASTVL